MSEQELEIRCPGCGARYWLEPAQVGTKAECGQCGKEFTVTADLSEPTVAVTVKLAFADEPMRSNKTISAFMRERGVQGGVSLDESGGSTDARDVLATDSGRRYAIGSMVARGGMGAILNCRDLNVRRNVAMKVMLNPEKVEQPQILRFIEEAQVTGQLEHPGVVPVYELGVDAGSNVFYTMKFVRGRTLKDILKDLSHRDAATLAAFPLNRLLNVFLRVCEAMAYAHHKHVLHRDLKPENIMIGDFGEVYVMDWGLAKVRMKEEGGRLKEEDGNDEIRGSRVAGRESRVEDGKTGAPRNEGSGEAVPPRQGTPSEPPSDPAKAGTERAKRGGRSPADAPTEIDHARKGLGGAGGNTLDGAVMGTPAYMAPEQARGLVSTLDARADVYALGGILYEILSLHRAVDGKNVKAILMKVANGELTPLPATADPAARPHCPGGQIPAALAAVAMKALALHPDDRYQTVKELQADIEAYQAGFATSAEHAGLWRQLVLLVQRHKTFAISALAVVLALAVGLTVALAQWRKAVRAEVAEAQQRRVAESARIAAEKARVDAESARDRAVAAETETKKAYVALEQENYCSTIALAEDKIKDAIIGEAEKLLWNTTPVLRGWEWGNLLLRCHQDLLTLPVVTSGSGVAFSPDGRYLLLTAGEDIKVWDMVASAEKFTLKGHTSQVMKVAWAPDGRTMLTGSYDCTARLWDAGTGKTIQAINLPGRPIMFVAYSPDSQRIVLGDASGHTTVWDAGHGTQVLDLIGEKPNASSVCFSPDGTVIITADSNGIQAVLWDVASGRQIRTFPGGFGIGSFSPDSRFLAIGMPATSGRVVNIWDLHSNTVTMTLKGHEMTVTAAKFSPDGSALITGSSDKTVRVWDVKTGTQRFALLGHSRSVYDVAFSPDGRTIATVSADGMVKLWSADGPFEPRQLEGEYGWQVGHGWTSLALSPDGHYVLAGTGSDARILDLSSGRYTKELKGHQANVKRVAWSRDGRRILTVSWDKTAKVWDSVDGRLIASLEGHKDKLADGAFSPNGQCVVTGAADKTARVWDATTGRELRQLSGHKGLVAAVAWSPDGQVIATSDQFGGVRLWGADVDTPPRSTEERGMVSLAFSADGRSLAGGDTAGKTFIWELPTLRRVLALVGHGDWVISSAFSPDGQLLATGARDGSVRLWNTVTGRSLINLPVGTAILSLEFFQDGKSLAVARATYSSQIWHALDWKTTTPESLQTYKLERYSAFLAAGKSGLGSQ